MGYKTKVLMDYFNGLFTILMDYLIGFYNSGTQMRYSYYYKTWENVFLRSRSRTWIWQAYSFPFLIIKIFYKKEVGAGTAVKHTPEIERVKKNQQNISSVSSLQH